jgi:CelD/BcsL family acetyltransferase involved in cellulose biosynthesis
MAEVTLCTSGAEFGALREEWTRLHRATPAATPFQTHAWLHSWWLSYGHRGALRVVLVRRAGRLVAAAPLMRRLRPVPVLTTLGTALSDYGDVLADADCPEALDDLAAALWRQAATGPIDLREIRPGATADAVYARWPGPRRRLDDSPCLDLPALPMDDLVGRLPRPRAQRARAKLRKLDAAGIERRVVAPHEVAGSVHRLLDLHRLQWQQRRITTEHLTPRFADHLVRSVTLMAASGDAHLTEFALDGEVVAADLTLRSPHLAGAYLYGAHPGLRERRIDVTAMLLRSCADHLQGGTPPGVLSLLRGTEPYKLHWRPEPSCNGRLLLARRSSAPQLAVLLAEDRARTRVRTARAAWRARKSGTDAPDAV